MSNPAEISQIMANAKKMIEEKKAQLGLNAQKQPDDKKAAILALKAKIAAASSQLEQRSDQIGFQRPMTIAEQISAAQQTQEERERSLNLIIDSEGRTVDKRTGEIVQIQSRVPTLKANIEAKKREITSRLKRSAGDMSSGIASTISGISSVFSTIAPEPSKEKAAAEEAAQSELFFDPRLK